MLLDSTSTLEFSVDSGTAVEFVASAQNDSGTAITGVFASGTSNGATPVTIIAAPAASNIRRVRYVCVRNGDTSSRTVTVRVDAGGTDREVRSLSLGVGEVLEYALPGWRVLDASGREKVAEGPSTHGAGRSISIYKTGTAAEAAGSWYGFLKDVGSPGAWAPGTPGINGATVTAPFGGALDLPSPSSAWYLKQLTAAASVLCTPKLVDLLWYNTGLVVTTTTAQAITTPAFPARDSNGSANGEGLMIGLYWTAASTNAAAIAGSTVTYTNQAGVGSKTATLIATAGNQIPATPVIGTLVWFQLAAGDTGVRSIQSISLVTSLVTGSVSLIVARPVWPPVPLVAVNVAGGAAIDPAGARIWTGSALFLTMLATATTALTVTGGLLLEDR